jgi:hypothetical protein
MFTALVVSISEFPEDYRAASNMVVVGGRGHAHVRCGAGMMSLQAKLCQGSFLMRRHPDEQLRLIQLQYMRNVTSV